MKRVFGLIALSSASLFANPDGANVVAGDVRFDGGPSMLQITASDRAIIDWNSFSIGASETTQFIQPGIDASILNRVVGGDISEILGTLQSNGKVYLINPAGLIVSESGLVDTAQFIGSTFDCLNADFLAGAELLFKGDSDASIVNCGTIRTSSGDVTLLARLVDNRGTIEGANVDLATQSEILLRPHNSPLVSVRLDNKNAQQIKNSGTISSPLSFAVKPRSEDASEFAMIDGRLHLVSEGFIYNEGNLAANEIVVAGTMFTNGGQTVAQESVQIDTRYLLNGGTLEAETIEAAVAVKYLDIDSSSIRASHISIDAKEMLFCSGSLTSPNGSIDLFANDITLAGAQIVAGEGNIRIGGDYQGLNPDVPMAQTVRVNQAASIRADANESGNGGRIIVWSDGATAFHGAASARGGSQSGHGGFIEISGKKELSYSGQASVDAPRGHAGTLLLDPQNVVIGYGSNYSLTKIPNPDTMGNHYCQFGTQNIFFNNNYLFIEDPTAFDGAGAAYVFNTSGSLKGTIQGSGPTDAVGYDYAGSNYSTTGYVVISPFWSDGTYFGALTPISQTFTGTHAVSHTNSYVSENAVDWGYANDLTYSVNYEMKNGNTVVSLPSWNNLTGAVIWINPNVSASGLIGDPSISLIGYAPGDQVGYAINTNASVTYELPNSNYVVISPYWGDSTGAVTWCSGSGGSSTVGVVSDANSLIGNAPGDSIGSGNIGLHSAGITILSNGNYVVSSPYFQNGSYEVGAVTWINGSNGQDGAGLRGSVVEGGVNSITGNAGYFDQISLNGIVALLNGNFLILSSAWNDGLGAATIGLGDTTSGKGKLAAGGGYGTVSYANSLTGATPDDFDSPSGVALYDGNAVIGTPSFYNEGANSGAATWINGTTGTNTLGEYGAIDPSVSLVGNYMDQVSSGSIIPLFNGGKYVVGSPLWGNGAGAATLCQASGDTVGPVTIYNSLIGETGSMDAIGLRDTIIPLFNSENYVVAVPAFDDNIGIAIWNHGATGGKTGIIAADMGVTGSSPGDQVGSKSVLALFNGNFFILSPHWNGQKGAITFCLGSTGLPPGGSHVVSAQNSLVGDFAYDQVGALPSRLESISFISSISSNVLYPIPTWNGNTGAFVVLNGATGTVGPVSKIGVTGLTNGDQVSSGIPGFFVNNRLSFEGGPITNYAAFSTDYNVVNSPDWGGGVGASTFFSYTITGIPGTVDASSSIIGPYAGQNPAATFVNSSSSPTTYAIGFPVSDTNREIILSPLYLPNGYHVYPNNLETGLNNGNNVNITADGSITISSPINSSNASASLTFDAGTTFKVGQPVSIAGLLTVIVDGKIIYSHKPGYLPVGFPLYPTAQLRGYTHFSQAINYLSNVFNAFDLSNIANFVNMPEK